MTLQTPETTDRVRQGDISYISLWMHDVERAAKFYASVLGWSSTPTGFGQARLVQDRSIPLGMSALKESVDYIRQHGLALPDVVSPTAYVVFAVDELGPALERVRAAGGLAGRPERAPYGLVGACADDQGLAFSLLEVPAATPSARPPAYGARQGDAVYLVFETPDTARARAFYGSVLGLQFSPGRAQDGWNVGEIVPMSGLIGGHAQPAIVPMFRVDDITDAVQRVRSADGQATDPLAEPYGMRAECNDDQGLRFHLWQIVR